MSKYKIEDAALRVRGRSDKGPESWAERDVDKLRWPYALDDPAVGFGETWALVYYESCACRLAACTNALRGVPTEALEAGAVRDLVAAAREVLAVLDGIARDEDCLTQVNGPPLRFVLRQALSRFEGVGA